MSEGYFAIAITRTCGSGGGSYIGRKLAADYGIDFYDRKLLRLASEDSGINEALFAQADETTRRSLLYKVSRSVYDGVDIPPESGNFTSDRALFAHQAKVLRKLLEQESYVCVGRAADLCCGTGPGSSRSFWTHPTRTASGGRWGVRASARPRPVGTSTGWTNTATTITPTIRTGGGKTCPTTTCAWIRPPWGWTTAFP